MRSVEGCAASAVPAAVAIALFIAVPRAGAQTQASAGSQGGGAAVGEALSQMTQTPATVPVTPEGRALARRLLAALDGPAKLHAFGELGLMAAKKQFAEQAQSAPAAQRAVVERAYFDALSEAQAHYEARAIDRMVDYYAHHLSPDDMTAATAFYASPLGARVVRPNPPLTEEERQEVGRAMLESPALQRVTAVQLALMKDQQAGSAREQARLVADTKAGFCRRLAAAHFKSPACVGAVQATASR